MSFPQRVECPKLDVLTHWNARIVLSYVIKTARRESIGVKWFMHYVWPMTMVASVSGTEHL